MVFHTMDVWDIDDAAFLEIDIDAAVAAASDRSEACDAETPEPEPEPKSEQQEARRRKGDAACSPRPSPRRQALQDQLDAANAQIAELLAAQRAGGASPSAASGAAKKETEKARRRRSSEQRRPLQAWAHNRSPDGAATQVSPKPSPNVRMPRAAMKQLHEEFACSICYELYLEPVTTACGHSFCRGCLEKAMRRCGRNCPQCRASVSSRTELRTNTALSAAVQLLFGAELANRPAPSPTPSGAAAGGAAATVASRIASGALRRTGRRRQRQRADLATESDGDFVPASTLLREQRPRRRDRTPEPDVAPSAAGGGEENLATGSPSAAIVVDEEPLTLAEQAGEVRRIMRQSRERIQDPQYFSKLEAELTQWQVSWSGQLGDGLGIGLRWCNCGGVCVPSTITRRTSSHYGRKFYGCPFLSVERPDGGCAFHELE